MYARLIALLAHPRAPAAGIALALLLALPSLGFGLMADDIPQRLIVLDWQGRLDVPPLLDQPRRHPLLDYFVFFHGDPALEALECERGLLPWWAPTDIKAAFLRPVTVATHLLDYALWPDAPWLMHLHNLGWMVLAVGLAFRLFRALHGVGPAAVLAGLVFALDDSHGAAVAWIANRNAFVALALSLATLLAHHRWRCDRWRWGLPLGLLAFALALLAGEASLPVAGYLLAHALFVEPRATPRWRALAALLPYAAVGLAWAIAYRSMGYGTAGADSYVDPASLGFVRALAERIPVLLSALWFHVPSDPWIVLPRAGQLLLVAVGAALVVVLFRAWLPLLRARRQARFWATGMGLSLIPICASFPMDRLLLFAGIGAAGLLAVWADERRRLGGSPPVRDGLLTAMLVLHLLVSPLLFPLKECGMWASAQAFTTAAALLPDDPAIEEQDLVFVNGSFFFTAYPAAVRAVRGEPVPRRALVLAHMLSEFEVTRLDPTTLRLHAPRGFLARPTEAVLRSANLPFAVGESFRRGPLEVRIHAVTAAGRPQTVEVTCDVPLDDPSLRWLIWRDDDLQPFTVPAVGGTVSVTPQWPVIDLSP